MLTDSSIHAPGLIASTGLAPAVPVSAAEAMLRRVFGVEFTIVDGLTGEVCRQSADQPELDWSLRGDLCRQVALRRQPELLDEETPLVVAAIPWVENDGQPWVAVSVFVTRQVGPQEDIAPAARALGIDPNEAAAWAVRQVPWAPEVLRRAGDAALELLAGQRRINRLTREADSLSQNISSTYEEISLLHRLTQNLKISKTDEELARMALDWLEEVLPARGLAIHLSRQGRWERSLGRESGRESVLLTRGDCPVDEAQFTRLVEYLAPSHDPASTPLVVNRGITEQFDWPCPQVRQMIAAPLAEGENLFGWIAAINHAEDAEFGSHEASLLGSIAVLLGIHNGNLSLYQQQAELMTGIIQALTAAIDAKDEYTCGHSDRVARIAVRLAQEMGLDTPTLNMIYLAGMLHDIGKIGIADSVLRKPGKLTDEEYQHIKTHTEIGHRILRDLKKLDNILPAILHHHESWDGHGYPRQLHEQEIPLAARIIAVADSYDAMSSNRPYRKGMPEEKIDGILREGAGRQWDPQVIAAFFRAREDIRQITGSEGEALGVGSGQ